MEHRYPMHMNPNQDPNRKPYDRNTAMRAFSVSLALALGMVALAAAEPYAAQLETLRSEITAKLPSIDNAAQQSIVGAKDPKARVEAVRKLTTLDPFLASNALDAKLVKFFVIHEATPAALEAFAAQGAEKKTLVDSLLADDALMLQMAVADGARPLHANSGKGAAAPNYGKAMEIYTAILQANPKAKQGILQRLALAVALEFSEPMGKEDSKQIDPLKRFLHFAKAREAGELDPSFDLLSTWELRFVVCAPEPDEALAWGREMMRNFRPDHILTENEGGRYANLVNTDVRYGSMNTRFYRP